MSLNPEFQRNLWLQLSLQRLIAAPVVVGLLVALYHLGEIGTRAKLAESAHFAFYLLVAFWGPRRAADSLAEEVVGGTWDMQRMSALGAWAMSWGKLLGSTVYVWYCAALCLAVYVYAKWPGPAVGLPDGRLFVDLLVMIGTGLLGQAVALAACLAILGRGAQGRRLPVTVSQLVGLLVVLLVPFGEYADPVVAARADTSWYGLPTQTASFTLFSLAAFLAWALIGVYRLMRIELQFKSYPFVWLLLGLFLIGYAEGFLYDALTEAAVPASTWLVLPTIIAAALTYLVLFLQPKDIVRYRWLAASLASGDLRRALALTPLWLPTFAVTLVLAIAIVILDLGGTYRLPGHIENLPEVGELLEGGWRLVVAGLLFMVRDIALVLYLNFNRRRRADVAAFIYLAVLYVPLPALAALLEGPLLLPLFLPTPGAGPWMAILPPLIQAVAMVGLLAARMAAARPVAAAVARPA